MPPVARPASTWETSASIVMLVTQIGATHGLVALDVGGGAGEHHAAGFDEIGAVGGLERHGGVLLDQEHGHVLVVVDGGEDAEEPLNDEGSEAEGRLVEEQELRAQHEG